MRRGLLFGAWLLAFGLVAGPAAAQGFQGESTKKTKPFPLVEGEFIIELTHQGNDDFTVKLVDETGALVQELVTALGPFNGTKRFRVDRRGFYMLDVEADDDWSARVRSVDEVAAEKANLTVEQADSIQYHEGRNEGEAAAAARGFSWGWAARGLAGGALAGPIGMAVVSSRAGRGEISVLSDAKAAPGDRGAAYLEGYEEGFLRRARMRRREAALVGGVIGTGILGYVLLRAFDVTGGGSGSVRPPTKPGG